MNLTKIIISNYTNDEINIIIEKLNDLNINWQRNIDIHILDNIDVKTYQYLIDFSKI